MCYSAVVIFMLINYYYRLALSTDACLLRTEWDISFVHRRRSRGSRFLPAFLRWSVAALASPESERPSRLLVIIPCLRRLLADALSPRLAMPRRLEEMTHSKRL